MKGKKVDSEFVSQFISECISHNILSLDDMAVRARNRIEAIDEKIKEAESLKSERSKLLDIVLSFQKPEKKTKIEDTKLLSLYKIKHHNICRFICDSLKDSPADLGVLVNGPHEGSAIVFCIKQLLENKVIIRNGNFFCRGALFDEYCVNVLKCEI